jgi:hypothetical protein
MGHMLHNFTDGLGHAVTAERIANLKTPEGRAALREAVPIHRDHCGEVPEMLHDEPVRVQYEMTSLGAEVSNVLIRGAVIPGAYFDSDTRKGWERDIQRSRDDAGFVQ